MCELVVLVLLLSSQAMMASAMADEPPLVTAAGPESCSTSDAGDPLAPGGDGCIDAEAPPRDCDAEAPVGGGDGARQEAGDPDDDSDSHESTGEGPGREQVAATDDPSATDSDNSDSAPPAPEVESCDDPTVQTPPDDGGRDNVEEPPAEEPPAEEAPGDSKQDDPAGDDRPAEEAPEAPEVEDSGSDEPRDPELANCVRTRPYLDCSVDPRSVVDHGSSSDGSDGSIEEETPAAPSSPAPRPAEEPRVEEAGSAFLPPVESSWQPAGSYSTAALVHALERDPVAREDPAPRSFAPFIVAGRASWSDTWGAPRFGPGAAVRQHEGQDVFCDHGAPVLASQEGIVEFDAGGLGGRVARVHRADGSYWYYAHLSGWNTTDFNSGDAVAAGDMIGFCGNTGNATTTSSHVHFGLYGPDGRAMDPMAWLVRWLRAAEKSAGLRPSGSPPLDSPVLGLTVEDGRSRGGAAMSRAPQAATGRADVFGDAARPLTSAGVSGPDLAAWPSTSPGRSDQTVEFIGIGLVLATAFLLWTRWWGDWGARGQGPRRKVHKRGRPGR